MNTKTAIKFVEIFTDGACRGNPGPGGWGAVLRYGKIEKKIGGAQKNTTNNRMELTAVIEALNYLKRPCHIKLTTDSQYVHKGMTQWLAGWERNHWRNKSKEEIKNKDLWQALSVAAKKHKIEWYWVEGHMGHEGNEEADRLANQALDYLLECGDGADAIKLDNDFLKAI
jgi:ribonuclease HI